VNKEIQYILAHSDDTTSTEEACYVMLRQLK